MYEAGVTADCVFGPGTPIPRAAMTVLTRIEEKIAAGKKK